MSEKKDYYAILGITDDEKKLTGDKFSDIVKKKFRKLSLKYHPDKQLGKSEEERKEAEEKFKDINEANTVLSDPHKRKQYDFGDSGVFGGMNDDYGFGPFASFFDGYMNRGQRVERGGDVQYEVRFTVNEALHGGTRNITYYRNQPCVSCNGTGSSDGKDTTCEHCRGTGRFVQTSRQGNSIFQQVTDCPYCQGTGKIISNPCPKCHGSGYEKEQSSVSIDIPSGVFDGAAIKLGGYGDIPKSKNGIPGDLIIIFREIKNEQFERNGSDVVYKLKLDLDEAWCGCDKEIPTIDGGNIKIKIPELTKNGKIFRCSGKGYPDINTKQHGDMYVAVEYNIPNSINKQQKKLLKEFYGRK